MRRVMVGALTLALLTTCSPDSLAEDASGEEIYAQLCSRCHGDDLGGTLVGPSLGPGSDAAEEADEFLTFTVVNGRGRMPSFESTLSDEQVDRLIGYIREVQNDE